MLRSNQRIRIANLNTIRLVWYVYVYVGVL